MRVLHVLPALRQSYGGPLRAVMDLSARAAGFGLKSELLGFGPVNIPDNPMDPGSIHSMPLAWESNFCYSRPLKSWLDENLRRFDGVVLHGMWTYPNWAVSAACREQRIAYACFPHGMLEPWAIYRQGPWKQLKKTIYWQLFERVIFRWAKCVFFTTDRERTLAEKTFHLGGMHLLLVPYGVETLAAPASSPDNSKLLFPADWKVLLFLGRIHPKKNVNFLIEAWHRAKPPKQWHLVIAGSGDANQCRDLQALTSRYALDDQVHFTGFVAGRDKAYLLQRAAWFALPSQQENFGIAVIEAIANGCPVVISDQVFVADLLHDQSEILPLAPERWVQFIRDRMTDDEWRARLARMDKQHLGDTLSIGKVAQDWANTLIQTFN